MRGKMTKSRTKKWGPTDAGIVMGIHLSETERPFEKEYCFHNSRKWRFDFAIPADKIAIEIEGGIWTNGAHVRGKHFLSDCEKYNQAVLLGWRVLRFTPEQVDEGEAIAFIKRVLENPP